MSSLGRVSPLLASALALACFAALASCTLLVDTTGLATGARADATDVTDALATDGTTMLPGDARADATDGPDADPGPCPGKGPAMVRAVSIVGSPYCIDSTEVTQGQYSAFLADTHGVVANQPAPRCGFNTDLTPGACAPGDYDPTGHADYPVVCVDWCDAWSYCAWAGKRLCGPIAGDGANGPAAEWVGACSRNGTLLYPYGNAYVKGTCNDSNPTGTTMPVGSKPGCVGGIPGLFDMSGNVDEWVDVCDANSCQARGGTYLEGDPVGDLTYAHLRCVSADIYHPPPGQRDAAVGFRCCRDALR